VTSKGWRRAGGLRLVKCGGEAVLGLHSRQPSQRNALHRRHERPRRPYLAAQDEIATGFTARYGCDRLVYFEMLDSAEAAITREKQLKEWRRDWKIALIEATNPDWADLYAGIAS
jgi:predicted GIY-YIG superfamily endonuclease